MLNHAVPDQFVFHRKKKTSLNIANTEIQPDKMIRVLSILSKALLDLNWFLLSCVCDNEMHFPVSKIKTGNREFSRIE